MSMLALVVGDLGNHENEPITSGSSRTFIAGCSAAHVGSSIAPHSLPDDPHPSEVVVESGNNNKTIIAGSPGCSSPNCMGSCGDLFTASHTTQTFIS